MRPIPRTLIALALASPQLAGAEPAGSPPTTPAPPLDVVIGGYVETYYQLNLRAPSNHLTNLRGFDDRDRTLTLSNVALDARGTRGPLAVRVVLQVGATPSAYYQAEPTLPGPAGATATGPERWKYLQQATLAYAAGKAVIDAGLFPSPVGPEVIPIKDNWSWSRSNLFFGLPFYHTGVRITYPLGARWSAMVHLYNGWNSVVDNNAAPSVAVSAAYTGPRLSGQLLYFGGIEGGPGSARPEAWRHLLDAYATFALAEVRVLAHVDGGLESTPHGTSGWLAGALSTQVPLGPKLYVAARADYFREHVADDGGATASPIFWPTTWIASATATLALQPIDGLSVRLEARHDHAQSEVFFGGEVAGDGVATPFVPNRRAQDTITLGAVAWF